MTHLSTDKPANKSIRKQVNKRIATALETLRRADLSDSDIHEARKALKKARASLRLIRPGLKSRAYRLENETLRDAAKPLSTLRDAKVLLDTLQLLAKRYGRPMRTLKLDGLNKALKKNRTQTRRAMVHGRPSALARSRHLLTESRRRIKDVEVLYDGWRCVGLGLQQIYRRGRRALREARHQPRPETFHEWRKQVKYLRYALETLTPVWPEMIEEVANQAHVLAAYLGDEHDLTVLMQTSAANEGSLQEATLSALRALIDRRQSELREKALSLGLRLYDEKPKVFAERIEHYWSEWARENASES
jgi:CHAD domain-containing protein